MTVKIVRIAADAPTFKSLKAGINALRVGDELIVTADKELLVKELQSILPYAELSPLSGVYGIGKKQFNVRASETKITKKRSDLTLRIERLPAVKVRG